MSAYDDINNFVILPTAAEITPIIKINHKKTGNGKVGKITKLLMSSYTNIVMNKNKKYSNWLTKVY